MAVVCDGKTKLSSLAGIQTPVTVTFNFSNMKIAQFEDRGVGF